MGFLAQAFARKSAANFDFLRQIAGWGMTSKSGKVVNTQTAIEVAAVFACVRVIANGIAQVPFKLMQESADGKQRLPAKKHALYQVLALRPNAWQTSFEYRQTLAMHIVLAGNHFSFVNRVSRHPISGTIGSHIAELIPFEPGQVTVKRAADWTLSYDVRAADGQVQNFPAEAIWHVRGPSWNSWTGLDSVRLARESIGLSMAIEEQQARMQKNGAKVSGTYSVEGSLTQPQYEALNKWVHENTVGESAGKALVLDRGAKWLNTSMTGIDAQTLETRRYQVEEVCRFMGVNPIMVGAESKNTTYASAGQMFLAHVVHTLAPWYQCIEQSADANLLSDADRAAGIYSNFVEEGLLRGSATETKDVILGYVNGGLITPNEGRGKLDMNPDADPVSDKLRVPANLVGAAPNVKNSDATAKALADLQDQLIRLETREAPAPVVNFHKGAFRNEHHAGDTHITTPAVKAPDVKVDVAPPAVHISAPAVTVSIEPEGRDSITTYERDAKTNEIIKSTTTRNSA